jgi:AraC family L-rhamnose operon transcriptional activator RhaR
MVSLNIDHPHCLDFENAPIFSTEIDNQISVPLHHHSFYEIAIVMKGTGEHRFDGVLLNVRPLDAFIIPIGSSHCWTHTQNLNILNIYYSPSHFTFPIDSVGLNSLYAMLFFASEFFDNPSMRKVVSFRIRPETLLSILKELSEAAIFRKFDDLSDAISKRELLAKIYLKDNQRLFSEGAFLKSISHLTVDYLTNRSLTTLRTKLHPVVYRLAEVLDKAAVAGSLPSLVEEAKILGLSPEYLTRLFAEAIGVPPLKFFNRRRLNYSKRLLVGSGMNVTQIAQRFGFADSSHFSHAFREHFNLTPSEFRKSAENGFKALITDENAAS